MSLMDIMHGEPDGLLREEGNYWIFLMVRIEKWCSLDDINSPQLANWTKAPTCPRLRFERFTQHSARARNDLTAHSVAFLSPVVKVPSREFWCCWVQRVAYL
eukprot:6179961-Pleurochrysis_carterae.AAC.3